MRHLNGQTAATGTQIQSTMHQLIMFNPRTDIVAQQFVNERTRHDNALINIKIKLALPCLMRQIRGRNMLHCAAFENGQHLFLLTLQQFSIQIRFQRIQRQIQSVQNQIGCLVMGIIASVSEKQSGIVKTADGETQQIANSGQLLSSLIEHNVLSCQFKNVEIITERPSENFSDGLRFNSA